METIEKCVIELGGGIAGNYIYGVTIEDLAEKLNCEIDNETVANKHVRYNLYGFDREFEIYKEEWHYPQYIKYDGIIITEIPWEENGYIIQQFCEDNNITRVYLLQHPEFQDKNGKTIAMTLAWKGVIPSRLWQHRPNLKDKYGMTVALWLAYKGIFPPPEWYHCPKLQNKYGWTVAMILAYKGFFPIWQWYHNPILVNEYGETVEMILAKKGITVPQEWL